MRQTLHKLLTLFLVIQITLFNIVPVVNAVEIPTAPTVPENTNVVPTAPATPENTTVVPTTPETPTAPTVEELTGQTNDTQQDTDEQEEQEEIVEESAPVSPTPTKVKEAGDPNRTSSDTSAAVQGVQLSPTPTPSNKVGDSSIKTGDATSTATVMATGNNNLAAGPSATLGGGTGAQVSNVGNGSDSTNNGSATIGNNNNTVQNNLANVNNSLNQSSSTGSNNNSGNTGGNSSIETGDANVTGTIITAVNTNVDGVMVSEFNIADDHVGDILLDFAANCVSGCGGELSANNLGNGSGSDNDAAIDIENNDVTFQNNEANIGSELVLSADSGNNIASSNTGGDSNITTGDANVSANALTFANNNIAGNVVYAVVNIFGDLIGDILFPEEAMNSCCGTNVAASNTGNGSSSTNDANIDLENNNETFQTNDADITNNLVFDAQTGDNASSKNTGGDSSIDTGDSNIEANVLNVVNSNLEGGNMWLVLVNEAGNWIGKLMGAPEGANYAASAGSEFSVDENGFITVSNNGNGSGSTNDASVSETNNNTTVQTNTATVGNNLNLSANTGGNETSKNTGGNSNITTGDANIVANLVNFVNNNISGNSKLFVTVVNVFGSWMGDFVSPGQKQEEKSHTQQSVGGPSQPQSTSSNNNTNTQAQNTVQVTPQPTTAHANTYAYAQASAVGTLSTTGNTSNGTGSNDGAVAGAQTALVKDAVYDPNKYFADTEASKKIKVNLAWALVALPLFALAYAVRRFGFRPNWKRS